VIQWILSNHLSIDSKVETGDRNLKCNSCDLEKEIVFDKEGFRLCNECLDKFMREHRFPK